MGPSNHSRSTKNKSCTLYTNKKNKYKEDGSYFFSKEKYEIMIMGYAKYKEQEKKSKYKGN